MAFDVSAYQRVRCTADTPVIRMAQGQSKEVVVTLKDSDNNPLDLATLAPVDTNGSSSSDAGPSVIMSVSQMLNSTLPPKYEIVGEILDASAGAVQFNFTSTETRYPGIFIGNVGVFFGGNLRYASAQYLEFMPTSFADAMNGPITIGEIRLDIMDRCPTANYLLDDLEFTDEEIIHAMRKAVDFYNDALPPIGGYTYDAFPYRSAWIKGTVAFLLQMMAHKFRRNTLKYSAGGLTLSDQEKFEEYERTGKQLEQEYSQWVTQRKIATNVARGYGCLHH